MTPPWSVAAEAKVAGWSALAAGDLQWLREKGITNVLNVTKRGQVKSHFEKMGEFNYKRLAIEDVLDAKIEECWDEAFQFLDAVADGGGNVLVHCRAGRSRSVSIVDALRSSANFSHGKMLLCRKACTVSSRSEAMKAVQRCP